MPLLPGIKRNYDVDLDPETEAIVTIGSKEGLAHLALAMIGPGRCRANPDTDLSHPHVQLHHCRRGGAWD